VLIVVICIKPLAERYLVLPHRDFLALATLLFAAEAFYNKIARIFNWPSSESTGWLCFAVLLTALAFSAMCIIFESEKRMLTIDNELSTARKIQFSILPPPFQKNQDLIVAAAYYPMTAVAGDFYDYLIIDEQHCSFLVADVSGHGIPAALIASMVKIAIQSALNFAAEQAKILKHLGNIIGPQLQGHFVTAACLFIDLAKNKAFYSAAGHPPLFYIRTADISAKKTSRILYLELQKWIPDAAAQQDDYSWIIIDVKH